MEQPFVPAPSFRKGEPLQANKLQQASDSINRVAAIVRPSIQVSAAGKRAYALTQRFRIVSTTADHLVCRAYDRGVVGTADVNVAKSYLCRQNPFEDDGRAGLTFVLTWKLTLRSQCSGPNGISHCRFQRNVRPAAAPDPKPGIRKKPAGIAAAVVS